MFKDSKEKFDRYAKKGDTDEIEALTEKLSADLRKSIKALGSFPVLSEQWLEMSDVFGRMAQISDMEAKLAQPKDTGGTLWETEEQALRYLIEDGKLNLCLRNLVDYKEFQRAKWITREPLNTSLLEKCDNFERGLGSVLRNAWNHLEALQTTDLPELVNYICDVLCAILDSPTSASIIFQLSDVSERQEILVFAYLAILMKNLERIAEGTLMSILRQRRAFMNGAAVLLTYQGNLQKTQLLRMAEALSLLADSESFATNYEEFVESRSDADSLQQLKTSCLAMFSSDTEARRILRPLNDCIDKAQRKYKKK